MIIVVTYLKDDEIITDDIIHAWLLISKFSETRCLIYSSVPVNLNNISDFQIKNIVFPDSTKYARLLHALHNETLSTDILISIDNDISIEDASFNKFLESAINSNCCIAWGQIAASHSHGLVPMLVTIDKYLSHKILRPLLWHFHCGITVPGQIMFLRCPYFNRLPEIDTYLDDIVIGLYSHNNFLPKQILRFPHVIGFEKPCKTFHDLWRQRKRWAQGLKSIIKSSFSCRDFRLLLIHCFFYHCLFLFYLPLLAASLYFFASPDVLLTISLIIVLINIILFMYYRQNIIIDSIVYLLIFPIFHIELLLTILLSYVKPNEN